MEKNNHVLIEYLTTSTNVAWHALLCAHTKYRNKMKNKMQCVSRFRVHRLKYRARRWHCSRCRSQQLNIEGEKLQCAASTHVAWLTCAFCTCVWVWVNTAYVFICMWFQVTKHRNVHKICISFNGNIFYLYREQRQRLLILVHLREKGGERAPNNYYQI